MFDALRGNAEGAGIAGIGGGVADVAANRRYWEEDQKADKAEDDGLDPVQDAIEKRQETLERIQDEIDTRLQAQGYYFTQEDWNDISELMATDSYRQKEIERLQREKGLSAKDANKVYDLAAELALLMGRDDLTPEEQARLQAIKDDPLFDKALDVATDAHAERNAKNTHTVKQSSFADSQDIDDAGRRVDSMETRGRTADEQDLLESVRSSSSPTQLFAQAGSGEVTPPPQANQPAMLFEPS